MPPAGLSSTGRPCRSLSRRSTADQLEDELARYCSGHPPSVGYWQDPPAESEHQPSAAADDQPQTHREQAHRRRLRNKHDRTREGAAALAEHALEHVAGLQRAPQRPGERAKRAEPDRLEPRPGRPT